MGRWIDATFYEHDGEVFAVCYRHLMRGTEVEGKRQTFFSLRLPPVEAANGGAADWISDFTLNVRRTGKVILASLEKRYGHLYAIGFTDCGGSKLFIELLGRLSDEIPLPHRPEPKPREFIPNAFVDIGDAYAKAVLDEIGPSKDAIDQMKKDLAIRRRSQS